MLSVTFDVDHKVLERGVYLAKLDRMENVYAVTLDIRLRRPYREEIMTEVEMHTFEHVYATAVRNAEETRDVQVLYFGPMGCNTGFYLLFQMTAESQEELEAKVNALPARMLRAARYVDSMERVPAANEYQCGNCYSLGDLSVARRMAKELEEILLDVCENGYTQYRRMDPELLARLEKGEE